MTERGTESIMLDDDRLATVRGIIGTIAHDFNNLLTPFLAYPQLIKNDLPEDASGRSLVDILEKTAQDMVHITQQLLELASKDNLAHFPVDVNELVSAVVSHMQSSGTIPARISVDSLLPPDIRKVDGVVDQIARVIHNVLSNAIEALEIEGQIEVRTENRRVEKGTTSAGMSHGSGDFVRISIKDNGPGISDEVTPHVFNPFFTTKKGGNRRGAGLGLSVAYMIVRNHGGFMDFESAPGKGTDFSVYLPVSGSTAVKSDAAPADHGVQDAGDDHVKCAGNRVMIVDDENSIQKLFQMILGSYMGDCSIDVAGNGEEAVRKFCENHPAVIIMDLHMPVMDGQAAFFKIEGLCKENNWEMPAVVFCTGFAPPDSIRYVIGPDSKHCLLSKPVRGETIVEAVKSRLPK